jgi:hypothetical protein
MLPAMSGAMMIATMAASISARRSRSRTADVCCAICKTSAHLAANSGEAERCDARCEQPHSMPVCTSWSAHSVPTHSSRTARGAAYARARPWISIRGGLPRAAAVGDSAAGVDARRHARRHTRRASEVRSLTLGGAAGRSVGQTSQSRLLACCRSNRFNPSAVAAGSEAARAQAQDRAPNWSDTARLRHGTRP